MQSYQNIENLSGRIKLIREKILVAGPCSVESEVQITKNVQLLADKKVSLIRAGIWKPRTHPDSFEGVGQKGLSWLKNAGTSVNLQVAVEVATPEHVEKCLKHSIDVLWIGARTTANPFYVQAIADSLKGVDIPIMVKNPINPDVGLWIGAIQRLNNSGIKKLIAVHRGFSIYEKTKYRNVPNWRIPIELKRRIPELPIICDPSHICGDKKLIFQVAQEAMDLLFDGLMVEVHTEPKYALSDAQQQLTPDEYEALINKLEFKKQSTDNGTFSRRMEYFRKEIDEIDDQIINLLAQRMSISRDIGQFKDHKNISRFQPNRWDEIVKSRIKAGEDKQLSRNFVMRVYERIHSESLRSQKLNVSDNENSDK